MENKCFNLVSCVYFNWFLGVNLLLKLSDLKCRYCSIHTFYKIVKCTLIIWYFAAALIGLVLLFNEPFCLQVIFGTEQDCSQTGFDSFSVAQPIASIALEVTSKHLGKSNYFRYSSRLHQFDKLVCGVCDTLYTAYTNVG